MSLQSKFASELYRKRKQLGYTQEKVASSVGISTRWYQYIEKGERLPGPEVMLKLFAFLEMEGKNLKEGNETNASVSAG